MKLLLVLCLCWIAKVLSETTLYSMVRTGQNPSVFQLSTISIETGLILPVGNNETRLEIPGGPTSGLSAIYNNVFYYMGDNGQGTTKVVGLRLQDSTEVCTVELPELAEVSAVGAGQTLDVDWGSGNLIATGPGSDAEDRKTHIAFSIDPVQCTKARLSFSYGNADAFPLFHGNVINEGVLYTTVQDATTGYYAVQAVDISGAADPYITMEYTEKAIWGLNWLPDDGGKLAGIAQDSSGHLVVNAIENVLEPDETYWSSVSTETERKYNVIWGNDGAVSAMGGISGTSDVLYFMASRGPGDVTGVDIVGVCPIYGHEITAAPLHGDAYDLYGAACIYNLEAYDP